MDDDYPLTTAVSFRMDTSEMQNTVIGLQDDYGGAEVVIAMYYDGSGISLAERVWMVPNTNIFDRWDGMRGPSSWTSD